MKKNIFKLTSLILIFSILACIFISCEKGPNFAKMTEAERADAIIDIAEGKSTANSYALEMILEGAGTYMGIDYEIGGIINMTYADIHSDSPSFHQESETVMKMNVNGTEITQKSSAVEGFRDGKMYDSKTEDGKSYALVSSISRENYDKHKNKLNGEVDNEAIKEAFKRATAKTSSALESGGWTATLSGYSSEDLDIILEDVLDTGYEEMFEGYKISDVSMTLTVTEDLIPAKAEYSFTFERTDTDTIYNKPEMTMTGTFKDIDTAVLPEVDFTKYTEVDDLASLLEVQKILRDLKRSEGISFTSDIYQKITYVSEEQIVKEIDTVTASTDENGNYSFKIKATANSGTANELLINVEYKNGNMKTSGAAIDTQNQKLTDAEAKSYIGTILDSLSFSSAYISDVELDGAGYTHVFTISDPDYSAYEQAYASLGATDFKAKAEIAVIYEDGVIKEMKCNMNVTAKIQGRVLNSNATNTITIENESSNS